ncbi:ATP-grasp domain-containing protein [Bradyrhizobium sp. OK095]|jgi:carbamoyl-phosphate synthase large subunit|uniref:ATP-grasp domain-containing protein n=1 Tax=Bradyrhizobium sp. OK095 TaxID=1882760 RepID=UPI0008D0067B|nr:ATP-grasp domain-containing protein [Bradyrhizobium sp. OK095]SEM33170.1 Carbamoylphosphate synthase large subunit [Bradyrhizobium sp. OK095]
MTIRVAITGISGDVGLGAIQGLRAALNGQDDIWLLGTDAGDDCPARHMVDVFTRLPVVAAPQYLDTLVSQLRANKIDVLLPGIDSEIILLSRERNRFETAGVKVALAPADLIEAADDKLATAAFVAAHGLNAPPTCDADAPQELEFPVIAKPRHGQGSKGIVILDDRRSLDAFLAERRPDYCLQRYVNGPEITIGFLYDWNGILRDAIAMERTLESGRTVRATVVRSPDILRFIEDFGARIIGAGAVNAQLRLHPELGPQIFEINARLSGSTAMRVAVGFNDPLRIVRHLARGVPMDRAAVYDATVCRASTELVVTRPAIEGTNLD